MSSDGSLIFIDERKKKLCKFANKQQQQQHVYERKEKKRIVIESIINTHTHTHTINLYDINVLDCFNEN